MNSHIRKYLLRSTMLVAAVSLGVTSTATAQDAEDDEVIVTGSRISQSANVVSASPVVTVDAELFDVRGTVDTIDLVNTLPSAFAAQTTAFANGATGTSTLNLRGLGSVRTLVLVDGKRLPPGGPLGGFAADLNLIAPQLVEKVEVVTGGASAVYGSDAIAGVANFITRKDFEGVEVDLQYGFNQSNNNSEFWRDNLSAAGIDPVTGSVTDNGTIQASAIIGTGLDDGRGNVTGFFNYSKNEGIQQGNRDFAQCATFPIGDDQLICLGSNQGPFPTTFVVGTAIDAAGNPVPLIDAAGNPVLNPDGTPASSGAFSLGENDGLTAGFNNAFNFNPFNPIRREVERFNAGFKGHFDVKDNVTAYMDFGFTSSTSPQVIAPSAAFGSSINRVNCDNPLLTDEARALICGTTDINGPFTRDTDGDGFAQVEIRRRFVEGGPRTDDRSRTNFRVVTGLKGELEGLDWDVFGQYSETNLSRVQFNQVTFANLQNALDIVTDPATGQPACRVAVNGTDPDCVPFTSAYQNGVASSPALRAYVDTPTLTTGKSTQAVFGGTLGGDIGFSTPWSEQGLSALVGFEYRQDTLFEQADGIASSGGLVGSGGATTPSNGETELYEVFAEGILPITETGSPLGALSLNGAYRFSEYASRDNNLNREGGEFSAHTYAVGASWEPIDSLRLRGQYQRAIRAPNVLELFDPQNTGLTNLTDPCAGFAGSQTPPTATADQCANTGLPSNLFGLVPPDSGQLNTLTGGNPNLTPEISDTFTFGAIFQPDFVDGLTISADYFDITLEDAVGSIPTDTTLNQCLTTGDAAFCDLIQRGPDGSLTFFPREQAFITATSQNIAEFATSGIDFQVLLNQDVGEWGELSFNYNSTYLLSLDTTTLPGTPSFDCVGFYNASCGNPNPEYRHNFQTTWQTPWDARISAVWRHFSGVDQVDSIDNGFGGTGDITSTVDAGFRSIDEQIESVNYLDLAAFYDVTERVTLRAGVNNVLDRNPPIVTTFGTTGVNVEANTVAGVYDAGGRFIFFGANFRY